MHDWSFASAVGSIRSIAAIERRSGQSSTGGSRHSFSGIKLLSLLLTLFALFAASSVSASTATAVKWQSYGGSPGALSAGSFTVVAPNVYDGPVGDTATGYSLAGGGTLCVLWDMGSSISISGYRTQFTGGGL